MKLNCIIIDDEPLAISVLQGYLERIPGIEVVETFNSAVPVFEYLQEHPIDFMFLDIEMPNLTGIEFVKCLQNPPLVVIISANRDYAIEGYELSVVDYVLKPLTFERLVKAVNKIFEASNLKNLKSMLAAETDYIFLRENKKNVRVKIDEILYIESIKDYVKVVTTSKTVVTKQSLSNFEELLNPNEFVRVHRSFIVAKKHIDAFSLASVEVGEVEIPIGRLYKENAVRRLGYSFE
ncbi:MAG: response regulator transcription factor [Bacteroidales bacterium]|nr:response regulator transcription factor [Bacteroidales bacterium]HPD95293.1 LytTR family DNA-binding domain-containing protein [Tenuifilaceae bacterium]HRX30561.1 LytTR family DNA-binding domain-containing protein [Tenuifilaceae bacterium]